MKTIIIIPLLFLLGGCWAFSGPANVAFMALSGSKLAGLPSAIHEEDNPYRVYYCHEPGTDNVYENDGPDCPSGHQRVH